jgi:hypothetical protein
MHVAASTRSFICRGDFASLGETRLRSRPLVREFPASAGYRIRFTFGSICGFRVPRVSEFGRARLYEVMTTFVQHFATTTCEYERKSN